MYKISVDKDGDTAIAFLDALTFIPATYEDCGPTVEAQQETFVIRFNKHYAPVAERVKHSGRNLIIVKALYDNSKMGEDPEKPQVITKAEAKRLVFTIVKQWQDLFHLSNAEIKKFWHEMIKKNYIIK